MISANFAVALVTVVIRGLIERFLPKPPVPQTSILPHSAGLVLLAGTLFLIYNRLVNGKRLCITFTGPANVRPLASTSLGRINKFRSICTRKNQNRSRVGRMRDNLLEAAKDSEHILNRMPSTYSISSKSSTSFKYNNEERQDTPDMYTSRDMTMPTTSQKPDGTYRNNYKSCGCGDWIREQKDKPSRTIKTRSGKKYSFYV